MCRLIFFLIILSVSGCASTGLKWDSVSGPTDNLSQSYGRYSAGCLDGAESLSASTDKYQAMRISRQRYYGHPRLIQFLERYSATVFEKELGALAIGDLSQPRGGPMPKGHASHQIGLDADIWFKRFSPAERQEMTLEDIDSMPAISMVDPDTLAINQNAWIEDNATVLKIASLDTDVERIFVNFTIKKKLCENHKGESWLSKIRPWWGHTYHYHVRLACPNESESCKAQKPVEENDGCDETLDWWFSEEAKKELEAKAEKEPKTVVLPSQCKKVFESESPEVKNFYSGK